MIVLHLIFSSDRWFRSLTNAGGSITATVI